MTTGVCRSKATLELVPESQGADAHSSGSTRSKQPGEETRNTEYMIDGR